MADVKWTNTLNKFCERYVKFDNSDIEIFKRWIISINSHKNKENNNDNDLSDKLSNYFNNGGKMFTLLQCGKHRSEFNNKCSMCFQHFKSDILGYLSELPSNNIISLDLKNYIMNGIKDYAKKTIY